MQLHELKVKIRQKDRKRVGRGGKRGTYSGRGIKGQKARSGHRIPPPGQELIRRIPKLRGVKFSVVRQKPAVINVGKLDALFDDTAITKETFINKGIIHRKSDRVKILGNGKVTKSFVIEGCLVSKKAKEKIEQVGGKVLTRKI